MAEYENQYRLMVRWLERIEEMAVMGGGKIEPVELRDNFVAFFQSCYHLKDHLVNDPTTNTTQSDVDKFIAGERCLTLCADICNATKHLQLNSSGWSGEEPEIGTGAHVTDNPRKGESSATYLVETKSGEKDAYDLAKDCRDAWDRFLRKQGLSIP